MNEGAPAPSSDRQGYVLNRPREDCRHTSALASIDGGTRSVSLDYRPVHAYTMTNEIDYIKPKARVY